ncbi:MAG: LPS assembly protein LptD [Acidiferrobacterales bacterium]|nr:LPS assembly protein LptD [Acidiferrobacterales bacterium]
MIIFAIGLSESAVSEQVPEPKAEQCLAVVAVDPNGDLRPLSDSEVELIANSVTVNDETLELSGNVVLRDNGRTINSEQMSYNRETNMVRTTDKTTISERGSQISGDDFVIDQARDALTGSNVEFVLFSIDAAGEDAPVLTVRGTAETLQADDGLWKMDEVSATHCPDGVDDVYVMATEIELNSDTRQGRAKGAVLMILDKPVFYSPILGFPLGSERLSGFLFPSIGYRSGHGAIIKAPYYFNLAPNYDATVSTNVLSKRGLQMEGEFRYLGMYSDTMLRAEFLPRDNRGIPPKMGDKSNANGDGGSESEGNVEPENGADDNSKPKVSHNPSKEKRYAAQLKSNWFNGSNLYSKLDFRWVSDDTYTNDFSTLFGSDDKYLQRSVEAGAFGDQYRFSFGADQYVIAKPMDDESERTHNRVPWATYDHSIPFGNSLNLDLGLSVDRFRHKTKFSATRYRTDSAIGYSVDKDFGRFDTRAGAETIEYHKQSNVPKDDDSRYTISSKYFEADGRLFFDRNVQKDGDVQLWTIEPRMKFTSTPRKSQEKIPIFDTTIRTIDVYDDLFESKPYVGGDRVRDMEQLSLGVSFTMNGGSDYQNIRKFGIGRIFYSSDRTPKLTESDDSDMTEMDDPDPDSNGPEMTESDDPDPDSNGPEMIESDEPDTESDKSDIFLGMNLIDARWQVDYGMLYDDKNDEITQSTLKLSRKFLDDAKFSTVYRFKRYDYQQIDADEQIGALLDLPLKSGWRSKFLVIESVRDHELKKALWQMDYYSCCLNLGFQVVREREANNKLDYSFKLLIAIDSFNFN